MFSRCSSLSDIKAFEKWNVSKGNIFKGMFSRCSYLDKKALNNWKVSKDDYNSMFYY